MAETLDLDAVADQHPSHVRIHADLIQGTDEWHAQRCGMLTASEMKLVVTPTFKAASNEKERAHLYELMAQRLTGYVEPHYVSDDMLRGHEDEQHVRELYSEHYAPVVEAGLITNDMWGFTLGYSPDGLVGDDGLIEVKSRRQKHHLETLVTREVPTEHLIQIQTALLVSERKWLDYVSYCGGLPLAVIRVLPDAVAMAAILDAATAFERRLAEKMDAYARWLSDTPKVVRTERRIEQEMYV